MFLNHYFNKIHKKFINHKFSNLAVHSSECKKNSIFFAVKGQKFDGNNYINDAIKNGAKTIVTQSKKILKKNGILFIKTNNVRKLISETAARIYSNKPKNLVAVTGTNGKSSIADYFFQIHQLNNKNSASIGTLGIKTTKKKIFTKNTTLEPVSLNKHLSYLKKNKTDNVILEASSHGLHQYRLNGNYFKKAIFTNLSHDHLDYHKSYNNYLESKLYLFKKLLVKYGTIITKDDFKYLKDLKKISLKKKFKIITVGEGDKSDLKLLSHSFENDVQKFSIQYKKKIYHAKTSLIGKTQLINLMMSILAAETKKLPIGKIIDCISNIKPPKGRLEKIIKLKNKSIVFLDYAHTPEAIEKTLENLKDQFPYQTISIVFGCGGDRDKKKRFKMGKIVDRFCGKIYITDDNPRFENPKTIRNQIKKGIKNKAYFEISSREKAIAQAIKKLETSEILLVAGKGHEETQDFGVKSVKFSDTQKIIKYGKIKNNNLSNNLKLNIFRDFVDLNIKKKINIKNCKINSGNIKKDDVFLALRGKKLHGRMFSNNAFRNGASLILTDRFNKRIPKNAQIIKEKPLELFTRVSEKVRISSGAKVVAITGSCGKTSLKEMVANTLEKFGDTCCSEKSYNNFIGVPLSLFNMKNKDSFGVFEVGMDKKGEIDSLTKLIKPDLGVITNITYAHAKNFNDIEGIAKAKAEIIYNIKKNGCLITNRDDNFYSFFRNISKKLKLNICSFSMKNKNADVFLQKIIKKNNYFILKIKVESKVLDFKVLYVYNNFIKNLLANVAVSYKLGLLWKLHKNIFRNFNFEDGRGNVIYLKIKKKKITLIDESYNSNPLSIKSTIENLEQFKSNGKKNLIISDMLELGKFSKNLHQKLATTINKSKVNLVHVIGKNVKYTYDKLLRNKRGNYFKKNSEIIEFILKDSMNSDVYAIKGSNATKLYNIPKYFKKQKNYAL